jgi:hypothetical protein
MKIQVSTSGGDYPVWQSDAKELFFLAGDLKLYSVQTVTETARPLSLSHCLRRAAIA